jgi:outer membrane protein assembly factor BamA
LWTVLVEGSSTGANSPFDLWTGAGEGLARPPLLRAHSLLDDNIIEGPVFGRALVHATGEFQHPVTEIHSTSIGAAVFVDTARAWHRVDGTTSSQPIDAGFGLRWTAPGLGNSVRIDLAHGLRDGGWMFSLGWMAAWPRQ